MSPKQDEDEIDRELAREASALPRTVEPPSTLWAGVAARIAAKQRRVVRIRRAAALGGVAAMAAALVLALRFAGTAPPASVAPVAKRIAPVPSEPASAAPPPAETPIPGEASYAKALAALTPTFEERKKTLPAGDALAIARSLAAIDAAITAAHAALVDHPDDLDLHTDLDRAYEQKIQTMNEVLEWTTRS